MARFVSTSRLDSLTIHQRLSRPSHRHDFRLITGLFTPSDRRRSSLAPLFPLRLAWRPSLPAKDLIKSYFEGPSHYVLRYITRTQTNRLIRFELSSTNLIQYSATHLHYAILTLSLQFGTMLAIQKLLKVRHSGQGSRGGAPKDAYNCNM